MPLSPEEKRTRHHAMFGVEDMDGYYKASFPEMSSHSMNAAGLLSDCQEMLLHMNDDIYISNGQAATAEEPHRHRRENPSPSQHGEVDSQPPSRRRRLINTQ